MADTKQPLFCSRLRTTHPLTLPPPRFKLPNTWSETFLAADTCFTAVFLEASCIFCSLQSTAHMALRNSEGRRKSCMCQEQDSGK